jgi:hypothetical protein
MQRDRIPKLLKNTNRGEEETEDDQWRDLWTTRLEQVNEWPNSLKVWWWWWWWYLCLVYFTTFSVTDYIASDEEVISELWIGMDLEGSGCGLILRLYPGICLRKPRKPQSG